MSDTTRTVLIALGIALLVLAVAPLLFMTGMMDGGMMGGMMGGGMMGGGMMGGLLLLLLVVGGALLALGLWRR